MNCERFQSVASDLARNEIIEASEQISALAHIEECERCAQSWSEQRELSDRLRIVSKQMNSLQAPDDLEERLRLAFRSRTSVRFSRPAPQHWRYWMTAAAAALLIFFGLIAWRALVFSGPRQALQAKSNGPVAVPSASPKPAPSPVAISGGNRGQKKSAPLNRRLGTPKLANTRQQKPSRDATAKRTKEPAINAASNTEAKEVTTDFVALGYGSALDLQDGGQLVRVELPRSALARFGLPMNMNRADERVKADVLVGADGLARAIRFVK
jgi:hypothetical protein